MKKLISLLLCFVIIAGFSLSVSAVNVTDYYIENIPPETTVSEFKTLLANVGSVSDNGSVLSDDNFISTGCKIILGDKSYYASVNGDVNGDGKIDAYDYLMIKRCFLGTFALGGTSLLAADIDQNGEIDAFDYLCIKRHFLGTYKIGTKENAESVPVLLYHHILPDKMKADGWEDNNITIAVSEFRRHMQMIKDSGYTVVPMSHLVEYVKGQRTLPEKSIVLCFDDGYKSNTEFAAPVLREFGYKATIFGILGYYFDPYEPFYEPNALQHVTKQDLKANSDVLEQQCHTYFNHNHLPKQSYDYIYEDLMMCQDNYPTKYFAYPYGEYNQTVIKAVKDAGFEAAFTTEPRNAVVGDNLYEIPRHPITSPMSDETFMRILSH